MKSKFLIPVLILVAALVLPALAQGQGAWAEPPAGPPNQNAPAPLNVSGATQIKEGSLVSKNVLWSYGRLWVLGPNDAPRNPISETGLLSIFTKGMVGASAYCDENGKNCSRPPFGAIVATTTPPAAGFWGGSLTGAIHNLNSGNVGIGTANPQRLLHLLSPNVNLIIENASSAADQRKKYITSAGGNLVLGKFTDAMSATEQVRIANDGSVRFSGLGAAAENATNNRIVTVDQSGNITWRNPGAWTGTTSPGGGSGTGDNLGNHIAENNLNMSGKAINNLRNIYAPPGQNFDIAYQQANDIHIKGNATTGSVNIGAGGTVPLTVSGSLSVAENSNFSKGLTVRGDPNTPPAANKVALSRDSTGFIKWGSFSVRQVPDDKTSSNIVTGAVARATCAADETLLGGGGWCDQNGYFGSHPDGNGWKVVCGPGEVTTTSWCFELTRGFYECNPTGTATAHARAICAKLQ